MVQKINELRSLTFCAFQTDHLFLFQNVKNTESNACVRPMDGPCTAFLPLLRRSERKDD